MKEDKERDMSGLGEIREQVLYRYENSFGHLALREYPVLRETRGGKWVRNSFDGTEYWVNSYSKKRLAYPTKEEALINFIKRTERHIMLATSNLERAREALDRAMVKRVEDNIELTMT